MQVSREEGVCTSPATIPRRYRSAFSLKNKFFIFFCTTVAVIAGIVSFKHTPIDAFPDVTNTKVTVITQWPGRSAEEVEKFITIPIEIAMNSVQNGYTFHHAFRAFGPPRDV